MEDKKICMNEQQWRLFEYNMSKWIFENKYILDNEEKKKFNKCANISLGSGLLNGSLVYFLCKKYKNYFTQFSRTFLTFSFGIYTSIILNKIYRRKAYTEILTSNTTISNKANEIMNEIINNNNNKILTESPKNNISNEDKNIKKFNENINNINNKNLDDSNNLILDDNFIKLDDTKMETNNNAPVFQDIYDQSKTELLNDIEKCKDINICTDEKLKKIIKTLEKYESKLF